MNTIILATHKNQLMPSMFNVITETEKAFKLEHESTLKTTWIPKSAMMINKGGYDSYTLADWFRRKMPIWQLSILQG